MTAETGTRESQRGSILLPVLLLLLLLATAATAMTLQARTSLREAATRRDRLALAAIADGSVRAIALVLATASAARSAPPFAIDGTPQGCRLGGSRQLWLAVQDEGGLVDLNKAQPELVATVLGRAGLSAPEAASLAGLIVARRGGSEHTASARGGKQQPQRGAPTAKATQEFVLADEIGDLPTVDIPLFTRLRPLFTTQNRSAGIDPTVAGPALRALIPVKELAAPDFEAMTTPSNHSDFTITASVATASGPTFARRTLFRLDAGAGPLGRFMTWDAPVLAQAADTENATFCQRLAATFAAP